MAPPSRSNALRATVMALGVALPFAVHARPQPHVDEVPRPGQCVYRQPGVKICSVLPDGEAAFDVYTAWPAYIHVRLDEPVTTFIEPDPRFFQSDKRDNTVTIIPIVRKLPDRRWQATISTATLTVTLNILPGSDTKADALVTIEDPERGRRKAQLEAMEKRAEAHAEELVPQVVLDALVYSDVSIKPVRGKAIVRNADLVILWAKDVLTLGKDRFLTFSIKNKGTEPLEVKGVRLWIDGRDTGGTFRLAHNPIGPNEEVAGAVQFEAPSYAKGIRLRIEDAAGKRSVELTNGALP